MIRQSYDTDLTDEQWELLKTAIPEARPGGRPRSLNQVREAAGRQAQPSAGSVDSQSVKTVRGGEGIGFDGVKKVKGRKRTILVDTMGLVLGICVHSAKRSDHQGMILLATFWAALWTSLKVIWVDSTFADSWLLKLTSTAIAALILELGALVLLYIARKEKSENKSTGSSATTH